MNAAARAVAAVLLPPPRSRRHRARLERHAERPRRRARRVALLITALLLGAQAILGAPALAQIPGVGDCKEPPNPERPGSGMVGVFDATPPDHGTDPSIYREFGYAGQVWHTYDLGCGPSGLRNPNAVVDTWTGNQVFNVGKNLVAATNGLHYELLDGQLLKPVDDLVMTGTVALYDSVFAPLFSLVAIILAVLLFRSIWRGDLANIGKRGMWALAALWFASITYLTPLIYAQALDAVLIEGTSAIQSGFFRQVGVEERDQLPTMLHETVVYQNWLRGEFGSPQAPEAKELGDDLVRAQAWSKSELAAGAPTAEEKRQSFTALADGQICPADGSGSTCGYFQGKDGSRMGAGFLAAGQGFALALFQLLAKAAILLAQVLLRVLILIGPVVGLIALVYHDVLRNVGKAVGAAVINVVVVAAMAGLHAFVLTSLFDPARGIPPLAQLLLATLITVIFLLICRPIRRMWQMVELSVSAVGGLAPGSPQGVLSRLRRRKQQQPTAQDEFWSQVRDMDTTEQDTKRSGDRRLRPEAAPTVVAVAERLDRRPVPRALPAGGGDLGGTGGAPMLAGPAHETPAALPAGPGEGRSRTVDTPPVVDTSWDRLEEPVLVPSQASSGTVAPRRAELEMVDGRPVWVVYRPSRGLEVRRW
ncbi:MAG TPA: hypothetical protein VFM37_11695 [Pseudonocardiaceae bacterium]|nr:hypothetical protein [Pseudonocardiaceae bacterium]